jgi:exportin-2 (importin alpha re-exporter)
MRPFSQTIFMLLLNRLQNKSSAQFKLSFVYFVCFISALEHVGPDLVISILDTIQPGCVITWHNPRAIDY